MQVPDAAESADGSVTTRQEADVTLPRAELERIWRPEYLERLARTYWSFLSRVSLGLLRVLYGPDMREIVVLTRPLVLLRFSAPDYEVDGERRAAVTWNIERGLLVAPTGRGQGHLRLEVERPDPHASDDPVTVRISSEVGNFYPTIAGWGWFARIGRYLYRFTQLNLHVIVTHAFLRSLVKRELEVSKVGALADPPAESADPAGR